MILNEWLRLCYQRFRSILTKAKTRTSVPISVIEYGLSYIALILASRRYEQIAIHKCVFTAFSEHPNRCLTVRFCFMSLKKDSISHLWRYMFAISNPLDSSSFVRFEINVSSSPVSGSQNFIRRSSLDKVSETCSQ